jgi:hypothetical protein
MEQKNLAKNITVVGSGGSLGAGVITACTSISASALNLSLSSPWLAAAGIAGFIAGAALSYAFEDKILHEAEKRAEDIEGKMSHQA